MVRGHPAGQDAVVDVSEHHESEFDAHELFVNKSYQAEFAGVTLCARGKGEEEREERVGGALGSSDMDT